MDSSTKNNSRSPYWLLGACCITGVASLQAVLVGCKASWQRVNESVVSDEPSFDRLLELEASMSPVSSERSSRKEGQRADSAPSERFASADESLEGASEVSPANFLKRTERALREQQDSERFRDAKSRSLSDSDHVKPAAYDEQSRSNAEAEDVGVEKSEKSDDRGSYYSLSDRDDSLDTPVRKDGMNHQASKVDPASASRREDERSMVRDASGSEPRVSKLEKPLSDELEPQERFTWQEHLNLAIRELNDKDNAPLTPEEKLRRAAITRMLQVSLGNETAAMERIADLEPNEQDYFLYQMQALHNAINPSANPVASRRWALVMMSQQKATSYASSLSDLAVNNAAFCTEVEGFGVVRKFPDYNFAADQELLLYCELDNFVCEETKTGYETQLQGSYEIVDAGGRRVAHQSLPLDSHTCRNRRRDYYIAYRIYMPPKIDRGDYTLKLLIEDVKGRKFGESSLDFAISR